MCLDQAQLYFLGCRMTDARPSLGNAGLNITVMSSIWESVSALRLTDLLPDRRGVATGFLRRSAAAFECRMDLSEGSNHQT